MVAWTRVVRVEMMKNGENQREFEDYNQQNMLMDYIWEVRERKISRITFGYLTCTTECLVEPFFFFLNLRIIGTKADLGFIYKQGLA